MTYAGDEFYGDDVTSGLLERTQPCNDCNGSGWDVDTGCCGNTYPDGECKAHCAIQVQVACSSCDGNGVVPA